MVDDDASQALVDAIDAATDSPASNAQVEWSAVNLPPAFASLSPSYGTPTASSWSSVQGVGRVGTDLGTEPSSSDILGFLVGGGTGIPGSVGLLSVFVHRNEEDEAGAAFRATV